MYEQMQKEKKRLEKQRHKIELQLASMPEGRLFHSLDGNHYKFYHSINGKKIYLPKAKLHLAKKLGLKRYLQLQLDDICQEISAINFYLRHHSTDPPRCMQLLEKIPIYRELLDEYYQPLSQDLLHWKNKEFKQNSKYLEHRLHKSISGNLLRSKSETLIDIALFTNNIPYRYECELKLGDIILYPDFTIRHPQTGKLYYWEHFGLMDEQNYCRNTISKLQLYMSHGIIPSIHLITTFETKEAPLTASQIDQVIQYYFH